MVFTVAVIAIAAGCAPESADAPQDGAGSPDGTSTIVVEWTIGSDCESCHIAEVDSATNPDCTYPKHAALSCTSCHSDDDQKLSAAHVGYAERDTKLPMRLSRTNVPRTACTVSGCHVPEELVADTAESTALVDRNGTVVNPHQMLIDPKHADAIIQCSSCHKMHANSASLITSAASTCTACHHKQVFECGTCHEV